MESQYIFDNAALPSGTIGVIAAKVYEPQAVFSLIPSTPAEWLIFCSTLLVLIQIVHWGYRFKQWYKRRNHTSRRKHD